MQKIILIGFLFLLAGCQQQDKLQHISARTDPQDFAASLYGYVLANQFLESPYDQEHFAKAFFTEDFFNHLTAVQNHDGQLKDAVGCLYFPIFRGVQDVFKRFLVGKVKNYTNHAMVSIDLAFDYQDKPQHQLDLYLVKTPQGWRIFDIVYQNPSTTLYSYLVNCLQQRGVFPE